MFCVTWLVREETFGMQVHRVGCKRASVYRWVSRKAALWANVPF